MNAVTLGSRVAGRNVAARSSSVAARPARATVVVRAAATTERKFNFSAGPACLPLDVLEEMKEDLVNYKCVYFHPRMRVRVARCALRDRRDEHRERSARQSRRGEAPPGSTFRPRCARSWFARSHRSRAVRAYPGDVQSPGGNRVINRTSTDVCRPHPTHHPPPITTQGHRHVRHGDVPPRQGFHEDRERGGG